MNANYTKLSIREVENLKFEVFIALLCRWFTGLTTSYPLKTKLRGLSPRANYTDRAVAAGWRS